MHTRPKSAEKLLPDVWRSMWANPILFVPPLAVHFLYALITIAFLAVFLGSVAISAAGIGGLFSRLTEGDWGQFLAGLGLYSLAMLAAFALVIVTVALFHSAGWGNMFAKAVSTGSADLGDYFDGIARFTPRLAVGLALKHCIHLIPILFGAAAWGLLALVFPAGIPVVTVLLFLLAPPLILLELLIAFFLYMWRPACLVDDLPVIESFSRGIRFAAKNWTAMLIVFIFRFIGALLLFGALSVFTAAGSVALREMEKFMNIPIGIAFSTSAGIASWALGFILQVFFTLYFFLLYANRARPPAEAAIAQPPQIPPDAAPAQSPTPDPQPPENQYSI